LHEAEVIVKTENVRVRVMSLSPHELADWHYHTQVTDDIFCLDGEILVCMQEPDEEMYLSPGQRVRVEPRRNHQLENLNDEVAAYLLVQGIGKYDFNRVNPKE
jgi:quercetin dioxygenase-like cupin family protein